MRRIFFALEVSDEGRRTLRDTVTQLEAHPTTERLRLRMSPAESLHNTLKFVGNVPSETVDALLADARQLPLPAPWLPSEWSGLDAFPSPARARVLVARATDPTGEVQELAAAFEEMCAAHGIARETRPYALHVTLARMRFPSQVRDLCEDISLAGTFKLGPIVLYESHLSPHGSTYEPLWKSI
jgi:RNA 2',3'-cyclic 3'-phosphodiesterase